MNANKFLTLPLLLGAMLFTSMPAHAQQGSASALYGIKEILLQYMRTGNSKASDDCGISREDISKTLEKFLKIEDVPVVSVADAKPPMIGVARIDLVPEIFSSGQGGDCTSWVALIAESKSNVLIQPVPVSRNVTVTYWRNGLLISSNQTVHPRLVGEALQKLAKQFAKQFHLDQPPPLPDLGAK